MPIRCQECDGTPQRYHVPICNISTIAAPRRDGSAACVDDAARDARYPSMKIRGNTQQESVVYDSDLLRATSATREFAALLME